MGKMKKVKMAKAKNMPLEKQIEEESFAKQSKRTKLRNKLCEDEKVKSFLIKFNSYF